MALTFENGLQGDSTKPQNLEHKRARITRASYCTNPAYTLLFLTLFPLWCRENDGKEKKKKSEVSLAEDALSSRPTNRRSATFEEIGRREKMFAPSRLALRRQSIESSARAVSPLTRAPVKRSSSSFPSPFRGAQIAQLCVFVVSVRARVSSCVCLEKNKKKGEGHMPGTRAELSQVSAEDHRWCFQLIAPKTIQRPSTCSQVRLKSRVVFH